MSTKPVYCWHWCQQSMSIVDINVNNCCLLLTLMSIVDINVNNNCWHLYNLSKLKEGNMHTQLSRKSQIKYEINKSHTLKKVEMNKRSMKSRRHLLSLYCVDRWVALLYVWWLWPISSQHVHLRLIMSFPRECILLFLGLSAARVLCWGGRTRQAAIACGQILWVCHTWEGLIF